MRRALLLLPFVLAACGSTKHATPPSFTVHTYGKGATKTWVFEPSAKPKLVVLFVHGLGDQKETTPTYHRPWLAHMAREGEEVVYPAYEAYPQQNGAMKHLVTGIATAAPHLAHGVPVAAIGYSRGGRLVADYASIADVTGVVPSRIFSVFPSGTMDTPLDLEPLDGRTKVLIVAGDQDRTVANIGANQLVTQLAIAGFPYKDVKFEVVRSHGFFVADHLSVLDDSPAAQQAFWARADRFFAPLVN
ncbi:MAG TPA: dienelactone hydrolase family protein [Gaiellaceae bacterium]|jgi:dienelactone hydrolase|nr:dienelactone hydrolase family protein [Gaiellaceae bacterium]